MSSKVVKSAAVQFLTPNLKDAGIDEARVTHRTLNAAIGDRDMKVDTERVNELHLKVKAYLGIESVPANPSRI